MPGNQLTRDKVICCAWSRGVCRRPRLKMPRDYVSLLVQPSVKSDHHRGGVGFPLEFILPGPLNADGLAEGAREDRRVCRHIVRTVVPVTTCALHVNNMHLFRRQLQEIGMRAAEWIYPLRAAPDGHAVPGII